MKRFDKFFTPPVLTIILLILFTNKLLSQGMDSLTNIGHASMKIKTSDGKVIYIDPSAPGDYSDSADVLLVTHNHGDHNNRSLVKVKPGGTVFTYENNLNGNYQTITHDNITVEAVPAYNQNHNRNQCVGFVIEFNGIKIYHSGDTGNIPEMADLASKDITYTLLPVDRQFTMTGEAATQAAAAIQAEYNIPMHTEGSPDDYNETNVASFTPPNRILVRNGETIALTSPATDVEDELSVPLEFNLKQNFPNPFNPATTISFTIPANSFVRLKIFDVNGEELITLLAKEMAAGEHTMNWNAEGTPSGVYFCRIESGGLSATKKIVLMK